MRNIVYRLFVYEGGHSALFKTEQAACEEAEFILVFQPEKIIMLVQLETDVCKHCNEPIFEKPGWIVHKWAHIMTGAYLCLLKLTQAEPNEED